MESQVLGPMRAKNEATSDDVKRKAEIKKTRIQFILRHMFLNLIVLVSPFQSRNLYVMELAGGDAAKAAAWQSYMSAGAAILEFLLNPVCGRLSDRYGRKLFLCLSPAVNTLTKFMVAATDGKYLPLVALDRILGGAITTVGGSTTCAAAISDVVKGPELAGAMGNLGSYAGLGVLVGPFISGQILAATNKVKYTYLFGAVIAAFQLVCNLTLFQETLEVSRPMDWAACNPLSFLKIFSGDSTVARLGLVGGLQCFPEGKSLADLNMAHISNTLKFKPQLQTAFVMSFGWSMIIAGSLPKKMIPKYLSQRDFTSVSNYLTVTALSLWGTTKSVLLFFLGLAVLCPSMERRAASSALATDLAVLRGFGKGEFQGLFANWRALCVAAAPMLYGTVYQRLGSKMPGAAYFVAALVTLGTECIFRAIPAEKLDVEKATQEVEKEKKAKAQ